MRAATTHSSGTTLFTFTALKCAITPIHGVEDNPADQAEQQPGNNNNLSSTRLTAVSRT